MTKVLSTASDGNGKLHGYCMVCPGCLTLLEENEFHSAMHMLPAQGWKFNGNLEQPTFTPSFRITHGIGNHICHFIITDGMINFCGDSTHKLAGQTVEMLDRDYDWWGREKYLEQLDDT